MSMLNKTLGRGYGQNALAVENSVHASFPGGGYFEDFPIGLSGWVLGTTLLDLAVTGGTAVPYRRRLHTSMPVISWDPTGTAANFISATYTVPGHYDPQIDQLYFIGAFRKNWASGVEQNVGLQVQVRQHLPGSVDPSISGTTSPTGTSLINSLETGATPTAFAAVIRRQMPPKVDPAVIEDFVLYQFDLGNDKRGTITDALRIRPLESLTIELGIDVTLQAGLGVDFAGGGVIRMVRNASLSNRDRRFNSDGGLLSSNGSNRYIH